MKNLGQIQIIYKSHPSSLLSFPFGVALFHSKSFSVFVQVKLFFFMGDFFLSSSNLRELLIFLEASHFFVPFFVPVFSDN